MMQAICASCRYHSLKTDGLISPEAGRRDSQTSETQTVPRLASYLCSARDSLCAVLGLAASGDPTALFSLLRSRHHTARALGSGAPPKRWPPASVNGLGGLLNATFFGKRRRADHRRHRPFQRPDRCGESPPLRDRSSVTCCSVLGLIHSIRRHKMHKEQAAAAAPAARTSVDLALAGRDRSHHPDGLSPRRPLQSRRLEPARRAEALVGHAPLSCSLPLDFCVFGFSLPDSQVFLPRRSGNMSKKKRPGNGSTARALLSC